MAHSSLTKLIMDKTASSLTDKRGLAEVTPPSQDHLQELGLLIHHVILSLQRDPSPGQPELLVLQLVPSCKHPKSHLISC